MARPWIAAIAAATACADPSGDAPSVGASATSDSTSGDTSDAASRTDAATTTGPGSTSSTDPPDVDTSTHAGDETTASSACVAIDPDPPWIGPWQADLVARLSGAAEIGPGVTLPDRATPQNRTIAREAILAELVALGLAADLHVYDDDGANVFAAIDATIPTEDVLVFGAHFDTVPQSPGANDNATGVAMALSLARFIDELPCRGKNVIVVLFDQEEIGLVGSDAFAQWLFDLHLPVVAAHTVDQMGWDADGDRTVELERPDRGLFREYQAASAQLPQPIPLTMTQTGFTDHVSFREWGFAAVGLTEEFVSGDTTPHYHLPSDTFTTVDLAYLHSSTVLVHQAFADLLAVDSG